MRQFDVWWIDQPNSRSNTQPPQPGDPSYKNRIFVIISPQAHLDSGGQPVCIAVGSKSHSNLFDLKLSTTECAVKKDCFIWCREIYTINKSHKTNNISTNMFLNNLGNIKHREAEIKTALRHFLELF